MATNVEIDESLMNEALRLTQLSSKRAVIDAALRALILLHSQKEVRDLRGRLHWTEGRDPWLTDKKRTRRR